MMKLRILREVLVYLCDYVYLYGRGENHAKEIELFDLNSYSRVCQMSSRSFLTTQFFYICLVHENKSKSKSVTTQRAG